MYISGINTEVDISIIEAEYWINAEPFTGLDGAVSNSDAILIRYLSLYMRETQVISKLMVGDLLSNFPVPRLVQ